MIAQSRFFHLWPFALAAMLRLSGCAPAHAAETVMTDSNGNLLRSLTVPSGVTIQAGGSGQVVATGIGGAVLVGKSGAVVAHSPESDTDEARGQCLYDAWMGARGSAADIRIGSGTYTVPHPLILDDDFTVGGAGIGATVVRAANNMTEEDGDAITDVRVIMPPLDPPYDEYPARTDNVRIADLTVDCNGAGQTGTGDNGAQAIWAFGSHIAVERVRVIGWACRLAGEASVVWLGALQSTNPNNGGTWTGGAENLAIRYCVAENPAAVANAGGLAAAFIIAGGGGRAYPDGWVTGGRIIGCTIRDVAAGTGAGQFAPHAHGIAFAGVKELIVGDNDIYLPAGSDATRAIHDDFWDADGVEIRGNRITSPDGIAVYLNSNSSLNNIGISGNSITVTGSTQRGILLSGKAGYPLARGVISGNRVRCTNGQTGVEVRYASDVAVTANVIETSGSAIVASTSVSSIQTYNNYSGSQAVVDPAGYRAAIGALGTGDTALTGSTYTMANQINSGDSSVATFGLLRASRFGCEGDFFPQHLFYTTSGSGGSVGIGGNPMGGYYMTTGVTGGYSQLSAYFHRLQSDQTIAVGGYALGAAFYAPASIGVTGTTGNLRFRVGVASGAYSAANPAAAMFGVEVSNTTGSMLQARAVAHNGSTYTAGTWGNIGQFTTERGGLAVFLSTTGTVTAWARNKGTGAWSQVCATGSGPTAGSLGGGVVTLSINDTGTASNIQYVSKAVTTTNITNP